MKQLLILSGKGGTGKTTVASSFIHIADAKAYADCDVDAPNLHLITGWTGDEEKKDFFGRPKAEIDPSRRSGRSAKDRYPLWEGRRNPFSPAHRSSR